MYRIVQGLKTFNVSQIMSKIKDKLQKDMKAEIEENPNFGEDIDVDHSKIKQTLYLSYILKIIRLMIIIFNISFFVGIFWLSFCKIKRDIEAYVETGEIHDHNHILKKHGTFLYEFNIEDKSPNF